MNRTLKDNENSKLNIQYYNKKLIITSNKSQSIKSLLFNQSFFSNSVVKRIISENRIYDKNNKTLSFKQIIEKGQKIYIDLFDRENSDYVPIEYPLEILYEDDFVIIINKPVDNILFFTKHNDKPCIASYLSHYYKKNKITAKFRFVNRLDKDTTGIIIVAKTKFSHTWLLENHEKIYIAVSPKLYKKAGKITVPLLRRMPYTYPCSTEGKEAYTSFREFLCNRNFSVSGVKIKTGRTHQIRAHFKYIGFPLVGDYAYGGMVTEKAQRYFLHCARLKFKHPISHRIIKIDAPLHQDMKTFIHEIKTMETVDIKI